MTERIPLEPEKYASCPEDGRILDYYRGVFDSVYVLLHPFQRPGSREQEWRWPRRLSKQERIDMCEAVSWEQILQTTSLDNLSDIDIGLKSMSFNLSAEFANRAFAESIASLEEGDILPPIEGDLPPLLENRLLESIKALGYDCLWVGDELCTERKLHSITDLVEGDMIHTHGCLFTHDHCLLVTTHWECHYSFLCSSREIIEKVLAFDRFEGFYCTDKTHVCWAVFGV